METNEKINSTKSQNRITFSRTLLLIVPAFFMTNFYFNNIGGFISIDMQFNPKRGGHLTFDNQTFDRVLANKVNDIDIFLKIPNSFLRFKIYVSNDNFIRDNGKKINTIIGADIGNQYQRITTGEKKYFNYILKNPLDLKNVPATFSVEVEEAILSETVQIGGKKSRYGLQPTTLSFLIVLFACTTLVYTFYFVLHKWYRFIRYFEI